MSHLIDTKKCEVGFEPAYQKSFKGRGREINEQRAAKKNFDKNFSKIDWSKK